jgi:threonine-phosphate decarboxylase
MIPVHGGDAAAAARHYGVDVRTLTDFSANISPYGPPPAVRDALLAAARDPRMLAPYPSPRYDSLNDALATSLGLDPTSIVVGNGASALLDAAIREARAPAWIVPVPAFSEYRRAISASGGQFIEYDLTETFDLEAPALIERLQCCPDAGVLLNRPHNPSGRCWDRRTVEAVLAYCIDANRSLVIDEAFISYDPAASLLREAVAYERAVVIRSLTKFYALAGVRIGYAAAHPQRAAALRTTLPSWPAGTLDERIACAALADDDYEHATLERTQREREHLAASLHAIGLHSQPSTANYLLVDLGIEPDVVDRVLASLARRGCLVRDCRTYERLERRAYIRIAVLDRERNAALTAALAAALGAHAD